MPFLTQFLLFRILEGERVPLAREVQEWPLLFFDAKYATAVRLALPLLDGWLFILGMGWNDNFLRWLANATDVPSIASMHSPLLIMAFVLLSPAVRATRRLIGEGGPLYSPVTRLLGHRLPLLARELGMVCREVERSGYDGSTIAARLQALQKRGLVFNSMAFALLRLPPVPGETKFRAKWEAARHPLPEKITVPDS